MTIVFPRHPLSSRKVEPDFEEEWEAAGEAGFERALLGAEIKGPILYRGWIDGRRPLSG